MSIVGAQREVRRYQAVIAQLQKSKSEHATGRDSAGMTMPVVVLLQSGQIITMFWAATVVFHISESRISNMSLLPQDVLVALKLALRENSISYAELAQDLGMSSSQTHAAVRRCADSGLMRKERRVNRQALVEFLVHGLKYVFPAKRGPIERGMPTGHSAPPLSDLIEAGGPPLVWPDPAGEIRGESLAPLHKSAPTASRRDERLYHALALIDGIRVGRARERTLASKQLEEMLLGGK